MIPGSISKTPGLRTVTYVAQPFDIDTSFRLRPVFTFCLKVIRSDGQSQTIFSLNAPGEISQCSGGGGGGGGRLGTENIAIGYT